MGRHSAAEDEQEQEPAEPATAVATVGVAPGRHHSAQEDETGPEPRTESGTHADLTLLRENPAVRARCAAAVIVPFLLYTVVLVVLGRAGVILVWVWIPVVLAGVSVGAFLDAAHRRAR